MNNGDVAQKRHRNEGAPRSQVPCCADGNRQSIIADAPGVIERLICNREVTGSSPVIAFPFSHREPAKHE